jgi:hypothetical protein
LADPVTLSWDAYHETIAGFKVYDSVTPGIYGAPIATIASGTATSHTMEIAQRTDATTHYFTITAFKASGVESPRSNEVSKLISALPIIVVIPNPGTPMVSVSNISQTSADVSWLPVDDGTGAHAILDIRLSLATVTNWGEMTSYACPSSPCTINGLLPGHRYSVRAVAKRVEGKNVFGLLSNIVTFDTQAEPPPVEPTGLTISKATPEEVIISASVLDCPSVSTSTKGSNSLVSVRTVSCNH